MAKQGVGASIPRKEDDRFLRGRGEYVGDIRLPGMRDVAFVRSPLAHARIKDIRIPPHLRDSVFIASDLAADTRPIRAVSRPAGLQPSDQPILAYDKVRQVGELIAMCVADTRAEAERHRGRRRSRLRGAARGPRHVARAASRFSAGARGVGRQRFSRDVRRHQHGGSLRRADQDHAAKSRPRARAWRRWRAAARLAVWHKRMDQLVLYTGNQQPHIVRNGLSECLNLEQLKIRIVSPDVGGGFGYKGIVLTEDVCLGWLAMRCGYPVRWIEDRREHLTAGANCREHHYNITVYADRDGKLAGVECEASVDPGAYSSYPFSACLEAAQIASILPGPYDFPSYRCRTWSVSTNKCPILPYRGVRAYRRLLRDRADDGCDRA